VFADGVEQWLAEQRGAPVPRERPEWARPGWFAEATAWVERQAEVLGRPELVRHWALSAVYRFPTTAGALYLKAVFPLFHHEPALTELVAAEFPQNAPEVVAADHDRGGTLIRELPGETARDAAGQGAWWSAVAVMARIHQAFAGRGEEVLAADAPNRGLAHVREAIGTLPGVDAIGAERLRSACDELATFELRETLVHGDFHHGNVSVDGEGPVIFDWSDACLAHPLVDLHAVFAYDEHEAGTRVSAGTPPPGRRTSASASSPPAGSRSRSHACTRH
jgi:Ser/Thr protein kinase RdoA (MazF antagonist)